MAKTQDGKHKSSKFRAARYDREHAKDKPEGEAGGARSQANKMNAKGEGNPESRFPGHAEGHAFGGDTGDDEHAEEMVHPGIHDEIKQIAAEHGPARTMNMTHDHAAMRSHVHSIHADGHEHHADHEGEMHHMNAHHHAAHAAGVPPEHVGDAGMGGDKEETDVEPNPGGESEPEEYGEPL